MSKKIIYILVALIALFLVLYWKQIQKNNDDYNRYMCANYGYEADCKTPLPADQRLK